MIGVSRTCRAFVPALGRLLATSSLLALVPALPALAQVADAVGPRQIEEIVITAQKREQSLQDVGMSVTAFSGTELDEYDVEKSFDIADMTPGVHISGNLAGQNTQFTIRGVTQNDFNDIVEAPVAVYLDEGYIAIAQGQTFATFDTERVEILKGPQGTLFGRNATGGLVHYISRKPVIGEWDGYLNATYGRFDSPADADGVELQGALNVPMTEMLAARVAFTWNKHGGYLKNNFPDGAVGGSPGPGAGADLGNDDTLAGRFNLLFEPRSDLRFLVSANAARSNLNTGPFQSKPTVGVFDLVNGSPELVNVIDAAPDETRLSIAPDGSDFGSDLDNDGLFGAADPDEALPFRLGAGTDFFGYLDPDGEDFSFSGDFAFKDANTTDSWGVNLNVAWDISEGMTLTAITDYKDFEKLLFIDVDSAPVNQSANFAAVDAQTFSQEIRIDGSTERARWVGGLYYLNIDNFSENGLKFPVGSVVPGAPFDLSSLASLDTDSYSIFGQVEFDLTSRLMVTAGLRVIQEEKDYVFNQALFFTQDSRQINQGEPLFIGPLFDQNGPKAFEDETSNTHWAGNIQLDFRASDDLLLYAAIKRGVKAGSFNAQLAGGQAVPDVEAAIPYTEEVLLSYEVGFKYDFWDGLARFNANAFYYDYDDYQAFLFTGVSGIVTNADAKYKGAEFEFKISPIEGLNMGLSGSYLDAEVKDVPLRIGGPITRDVRPTYAPEFQLAGMVRYEWPIFGGMMSVLLDASYSDEFFYNLRNFDADKFDSYVMANARLGWLSGDGKWEASFKVKNLADSRAGVQGFDLATLCGCNEISFRPPRWFGFSIKRAI